MVQVKLLWHVKSPNALRLHGAKGRNEMEIILRQQVGLQVLVTCNGQFSHTFDHFPLIPHVENGLLQPPDDPIAYGRAIYDALFPEGTLTRRGLEQRSERILLVATESDLDAIPWEYVYGSYGSEDSEGFLILECHFVRGIHTDQRVAPPTLDSALHIIAIPSNPLSTDLAPLNIDGEWLNLKEIVQHVPTSIILERTYPPTITQVRRLVTNQRHRIIHFMGHVEPNNQKGALLCFTKEDGTLDPVTVKEFIQCVRGTVFLVTLNACVSATPGEAGFSNLAAALVRQQVPYALGTRFNIHDDDARDFSKTFYSELARGVSVEEALRQARLALVDSPRCWAIGIPALYTSLSDPATGYASKAGTPVVDEHRPHIEVTALPRVERTIEGRINELQQLGTLLTGDSRPNIITIRGSGGQGKTVLAREAVERFAFAWPGGVWATSLEALPTRERFVADLARFLDIATQDLTDSTGVEQQILDKLREQRTLLVLDNAETLVQAMANDNPEAVRLAQFLREQLPKLTVSLLVTSRSYLQWNDEIGLELEGLTPLESISLFKQHASQRIAEIEAERVLLWSLCEKIEGHPLSLRLLGSTFNTSDLSLQMFVSEYEAQLFQAENKYAGVNHRQRTLYTSIETSVRYLDEATRQLFSGLWIFHAPFSPETATAVFERDYDPLTGKQPHTINQLYTLWHHGLLVYETTVELKEETIQFYRLPATIRPYVERYLSQQEEHEQLLARFGEACAVEVLYLWKEINRGSAVASLASLLQEDLERGMSYITGMPRGYYLLDWGWVLHRMGNRRRGLELIEQALEFGQEHADEQLVRLAYQYMGLIYYAMGQPRQALAIFELSLSLIRNAEDSLGEFSTLNNMALAYTELGKHEQALKLLEQYSLYASKIGDRAREGTVLSNISMVYRNLGQGQKAWELAEQALSIRHEAGDLAGIATTLSHIASMYYDKEQWQQALKTEEQILSIKRELGDKVGEVTALHDIATILYMKMNQTQQALEIYDQILPVRHKLNDHVGEVATLLSLAQIYQDKKQWQQALDLYKQALQTQLLVPDRVDIVTILNQMANIYHITEQPEEALAVFEQILAVQSKANDHKGVVETLARMGIMHRTMGNLEEALEVYEKALSMAHELGERELEASILNNMGVIYRITDQTQRALDSYQPLLLICRELGNQAGEAHVFNNMAFAYHDLGQVEQALELYGQALSVARACGHTEIEVAVLFHSALMLYQKLGRTREAITRIKYAIALFKLNGLPQDSAGHTERDLRQALFIMYARVSLHGLTDAPGTLPPAEIQSMVAHTVLAMTTMSDQRAEWREAVVYALQKNQQSGAIEQIEVDFFTAIIALLDDQPLSLPTDHPYAPAIAEIQAAIAAAPPQEESEDSYDDDEDQLFTSDLLLNSVTALLGDLEQKTAHAQYLTAMSTQTTDEGLKALIQNILFALFGGDITRLGQNLDGVYRMVWEVIIHGVEIGGREPLLLELLVQDTVAVFRPVLDEGKKNIWQDFLLRAEMKAIDDDNHELAMLLDAVNGLLNANGNPTGLGVGLTGIYAQTWQKIVSALHDNQ